MKDRIDRRCGKWYVTYKGKERILAEYVTATLYSDKLRGRCQRHYYSRLHGEPHHSVADIVTLEKLEPIRIENPQGWGRNRSRKKATKQAQPVRGEIESLFSPRMAL